MSYQYLFVLHISLSINLFLCRIYIYLFVLQIDYYILIYIYTIIYYLFISISIPRKKNVVLALCQIRKLGKSQNKIEIPRPFPSVADSQTTHVLNIKREKT